MPRYTTIIRWSPEDGLFVADVPELPGCFADGPTRAQAVANAELVIRQWIETARSEGRPVPPPRIQA